MGLQLLKKVKGNEGNLLFPSLACVNPRIRSLDKPASYDCLLNQFKALIIEAGVSKEAIGYSLYSLRRGGVTAAVNAQVTEHYIQKQMRVSSASTVRKYSTVNNENLGKIGWAILNLSFTMLSCHVVMLLYSYIISSCRHAFLAYSLVVIPAILLIVANLAFKGILSNCNHVLANKSDNKHTQIKCFPVY